MQFNSTIQGLPRYDPFRKFNFSKTPGGTISEKTTTAEKTEAYSVCTKSGTDVDFVCIGIRVTQSASIRSKGILAAMRGICGDAFTHSTDERCHPSTTQRQNWRNWRNWQNPKSPLSSKNARYPQQLPCNKRAVASFLENKNSFGQQRLGDFLVNMHKCVRILKVRAKGINTNEPNTNPYYPLPQDTKKKRNRHRNYNLPNRPEIQNNPSLVKKTPRIKATQGTPTGINSRTRPARSLSGSEAPTKGAQMAP